jgi:hypothetical protein
MSNTKLIKALRCKTTNVNDCTLCAYHNACYDGTLESIAADELEADEKFIAEFIKNIKLLRKQVVRLRVQLPKEGKWIAEPMTREKFYNDPYLSVKCSICGANSREIGRYCPNCGANMKGERQ